MIQKCSLKFTAVDLCSASEMCSVHFFHKTVVIRSVVNVTVIHLLCYFMLCAFVTYSIKLLLIVVLLCCVLSQRLPIPLPVRKSPMEMLSLPGTSGACFSH